MTREKMSPLNPGEAMCLRQCISLLSESGKKQMLLGLINVLSSKNSISRKVFEEILVDAQKYVDAIKQL